MGFDSFARKFFPSLSKVTYNPLFSVAVNVLDRPISSLFSEFAILPPNNMRIRIGVGNRIFNNQVKYVTESYSFWLFAALNGYFKIDSTILDIGVGVGRSAHILRDFDFCGEQFKGSYIGIDIDPEMLSWCKKSFDQARFRFHRSSNVSTSYNQIGNSPVVYTIPEPDSSVDLVFSRSLFTHLLEREAENYLTESFRLLRSNGHAIHSIFCMDYPPPTLGDRHTFSHRLGNSYVESLKQPEAAVAYSEAFLLDICKRIGFQSTTIRHHPKGWQPVLICRK